MPETPEFTAREMSLFIATLNACRAHYFEWGIGGSTQVAVDYVKRVTSVDSSLTWVKSVEGLLGHPSNLTAIHINIGPVKAWGYPESSPANSWFDYPNAVIGAKPDLVLVDGRFRVACALTVMLDVPSAVLLVHDYAPRSHYATIGTFAKEVARAERLSVFVRQPAMDEIAARNTLRGFYDDPR